MKHMALLTLSVCLLGLVFAGCLDRIETPTEAPGAQTGPTASSLPGTEMLGDIGIALQLGTGIVASGVGLRGDPADQPKDININVPGTVVHAFLYWEGQNATDGGDADITVNGSPVTGALIGGPTLFFSGAWSSSYRADITGMVSSGNNTLSIGDMDFTRCSGSDCRNNGAGVVVIYNDGSSPTADIGIADGNDLAFFDFDAPLDTTEPVTFGFPSSSSSRTATLVLMAGSVAANRPNIVEVTMNATTTQIVDPFQNTNGPDWDAVTFPVTVPSGVTSMDVQCLSEKAGSSQLTGQPASLAWVVAALSVPGERGEGCTPGYWKNHLFAWDDTPYSTGDDFDTVFGTDLFDPDLTLGQAIKHGGGGEFRLGRHGTAALLSAAHPHVNYGLTVGEVIQAVQDGDADLLEFHNEQDCPLGNEKHNDALGGDNSAERKGSVRN